MAPPGKIRFPIFLRPGVRGQKSASFPRQNTVPTNECKNQLHPQPIISDSESECRASQPLWSFMGRHLIKFSVKVSPKTVGRHTYSAEAYSCSTTPQQHQRVTHSTQSTQMRLGTANGQSFPKLGWVELGSKSGETFGQNQINVIP